MKYLKPEMEVWYLDDVPITQISTVEGESADVPKVDIGDVDW